MCKKKKAKCDCGCKKETRGRCVVEKPKRLKKEPIDDVFDILGRSEVNPPPQFAKVVFPHHIHTRNGTSLR